MINKIYITGGKALMFNIGFGLVIMFFTQNAIAETALEKSILEIKRAMQNFGNIPEKQNTNNSNQNSNISDVFGNEAPVKQSTPNYLWKNKEDFFSAVSKGELINFEVQPNTEENRLMTLSIKYLLSSSYQTPVNIPESNGICLMLFNDRTTFLIELINKSKLSKLGKNPPEFIGGDENLVESNNTLGRGHFNHMSDSCSVNFAGSKSPYPFIDSLSLLLKQYSSLTETYVNEMRLKKIEDYKVAQEKNRVVELEKIASNSQMKVLEKEEEEKNDRETKFREEFKRKEDLKRSDCLASQQYARYTAAKSIEENLARIKSSREIIKREKEISSKSGYEDGNKLYEQGQIIVYSEESIKKLNVNYRKNGGTESNVTKINAGKNPCKFN